VRFRHLGRQQLDRTAVVAQPSCTISLDHFGHRSVCQLHAVARSTHAHDGRTSNLVDAIRAHKSHGSEANKVIEHFNRLNVQEQQEKIDFLRSL
jgi:hypothetical protein